MADQPAATPAAVSPTPNPMPKPQPKDVVSAADAGVPPIGTEQQATIDELPEARPQIGFWQQRWVQEIVPFATSFIVHAVVIVTGLLLIEPIAQAVKVVKEQIIIPDATIVEGADPGGVPNPGLGEDPNRAAAQDQIADVPPDAAGLAASQVQTLNQTLVSGGSSDETVNPLARGPMAGGPGSSNTTGMGDGEQGGGTAPFGIPGGGGGVGPKSSFIGMGGNARKIVYLVDASGTMGSIFPAVVAQLQDSIKDLKPIQGFNIIFFQQDDVIAFNDSRLEMATPENKRRAYAFIAQVVPKLGTIPEGAIRKTFTMKPELVYVLSDGFDQVTDLNSVPKLFGELNGTKAKINTVLIGGKNDEIYQDIMRKIADQSGGRFKVVDPNDL